MTRRIPDTGGQTPLWLPELIVERYFPELAGHDFVVEPSWTMEAEEPKASPAAGFGLHEDGHAP